MYTIKTLNAISPAGLAKLPVSQFEVDNDDHRPPGHPGAQRRHARDAAAGQPAGHRPRGCRHQQHPH